MGVTGLKEPSSSMISIENNFSILTKYFTYNRVDSFISSQLNSVELFHVINSHSDDGLIVYLPDTKIVLNSDLYNP